MPAVAKRQTAEERREAILAAAIVEFARGGLEGTSTDGVARRAGISQPYVFRLFGTKKQLFLETVRRCFRETIETFRAAAAAAPGAELQAMGKAYVELLEDRDRLRVQLHAYTASGDPEVREVVQRGLGDIFMLAEEVSGAPAEEVAGWLAQGMLLNVVAAVDLEHSSAPWARRLLDACRKG